MPTFANTTFSTLITLAKWESEIAQLISGAANDYLATAVNIASGTDPITALITSVNVQDGKGVIEILGKAKTALTIKDGKTLSIKIYDSADDVTFAEIHNGQRVFYRAASGSDISIAAGTELFRWVVPSDSEDYVKSLIASDATNSGTIDIYTVSLWEAKIDKAKDLMGVDIEVVLVNRGLDYWLDQEGGEVVNDIITNYSDEVWVIACDFKTLFLIYQDLSEGNEESNWYGKMMKYKNRYKEALSNAMKLADLDLDQDAETDIYGANLEKIGRNTR